MAKLPAVKPRQVIRFLEQNGFVLDHTSGSHLVYYQPEIPPARCHSSAQPRHGKRNADVSTAGSRLRPRRPDLLLGRLKSPGPLSSTPPTVSVFLSPASASRRKTSDIRQTADSAPATCRASVSCAESYPAHEQGWVASHPRLILPAPYWDRNDT